MPNIGFRLEVGSTYKLFWFSKSVDVLRESDFAK